MRCIFRHYGWYINVRSLDRLICNADPDAFTKVQVDRGAIKFVLSGANIMYVGLVHSLMDRCPGLTSKGAWMPEDNIPLDTIVAVMAEGKEHALAVGQMKMTSDDIRSINKGIGVETLTSLGDPLWSLVS